MHLDGTGTFYDFQFLGPWLDSAVADELGILFQRKDETQ